MEKLQSLMSRDRKFTTDLIHKILNNSHISICLRRDDYTTYWANRSYLEETNVSLKELAQNPCYKLRHNKNQPCSDCALTSAIESGQPQKKIIEDPKERTFNVYCEPISTRNVPLYLYIIQDLTREKKLNQKLNQEMMKTNYFSNLSHELRTPLNLMHSTLQLLEITLNKNDFEQNLEQKMRKYYQIIKQNNLRLIKLVNNILDINKIGLDRYELTFKNTDIVKVIKNICESSLEYAREQSKELIFETDLEQELIAIDPFEIERVLLNLISNAVKFTEPGDRITVSLHKTENNIIITVEDTGIGIPDEQKNIIFEQFQQLDNPLATQSKGSGLGLYIAKLIIDMHGGNISVKGEPGQGSSFIIELPAKITEKTTDIPDRELKNIVDRINIEFSDIYY